MNRKSVRSVFLTPKLNNIVFLVSVTTLFNFGVCYAKKTLPVPTGSWYSGSALLESMDSCSRISWSYPITATSKYALVATIFASLPIHKECTWSAPMFDSFSTLSPSDFPGFNKSDYQDVITRGGPQTENWIALCKNENGNIEHDVKHTIFPTYKCPERSRIGIDKNHNSPALFCTTTPQVCTADVLGRDLDSFGLGMLGHVGLATDTNLDNWTVGNYVVEVLNNDDVININSLSSFEHPTSGSFWGEVYGLPNLTYIDASQASDAILRGLEQRHYNPRYTLTAQWQSGGSQEAILLNSKTKQLINQSVIRQAVFRCDTFVNYCLKKGFNVTVPTSTVILPKFTFGSFLHKRTDVPLQKAKTSTAQAAAGFTSALNESNWLALDAMVKNYNDAPSLSLKKKGMTLWGMAQQYQNKPAQYGYLVDSISLGQHSHFMIPSFIKAYTQQSSLENKTKLISAVAQSSVIPLTEQLSLTQERKQSILDGQQFLLNILKTEQQPQLLNEALTVSSIILPATTENYIIIHDAIEKFWHLSGKNDVKNKFYLLTLSMALANSKMQTTQLPILLDAPRNNKENNVFNKDLLLLLKKLDPTSLVHTSKTLLKSYMVRQNSIKNYLDGSPLLTQANNINYLYALATVSSTDWNSKKQFIVDYIIKANKIDQAWFISQADKDLLSRIQPAIRDALRKSLQHEMVTSKNVQHYLLYAKAITKLNSIL